MTAYSKGILSKEKLIQDAREQFNESGLTLSLCNLAKRLDMTLGKITYHFPTKDHLFIAIAEEYESQLARMKRDENVAFSLEMMYELVARVLDLQYNYRCAMRYIASSSRQQSDLFRVLSETFRNNKNRILNSTKALVENGELNVAILDESNFSVFLFCFINLFTTWPINLEIYDSGKTYQEMKPIYLRGIFSVYLPYLTPKGYESLKKAGLF